ncbi:hypothetical protein PCL_09592 [Purpureocillium lilacinum]|uniref:Uncharacterized protein n=1 Tax=Purpureocillium lilacinum TaxID=33203 RepID=A0A2U3DQI6_PURLI|nr:hypothetical protein PCL_09592 [Purpureocillium lilacinum]
MPRNTLLSRGFLPKVSMRLGHFLVDVNEPLVSLHDPEIEIKPESDIVVSHHLSYSESQQARSGHGLAATLTSLLSASCSKKMNTSTRVSAARVTLYKLANSGSHFRRAVKGPATRSWIEEQKDDGWDNLFFVVGYYTMLDANIILGAEESQGVQGQVEVPVSAALAAGGIVLPVGGITDPKVSAKYEESQGAKIQFVAPGERICALQCRKVVFKWFSSGCIDKAKLDRDNRWHTLSTLRDLRGRKDSEDDVLEVELDDDDEDGDEVFDEESK